MGVGWMGRITVAEGDGRAAERGIERDKVGDSGLGTWEKECGCGRAWA